MKKLLLLFFLSWCCSCVEEGDFETEFGKWVSVTTSDGLPGNLITTIYSDSKGNVWIGTTNGLSMYDGSSFTNYSETNGPLTNNWVLAIMEDRFGNILVGTRNGLSLFDGDTWFYVPVLTDLEVTSLVEADNGDIWVGTLGSAVFQFFNAGGNVQHFDDVCNDCNFVQALFKDSDGIIWIGSQADLKLYDGSFQSFTEADGLAGPIVTAIGSDSWGDIWIGGYNQSFITKYVDSDFEQRPLVKADAFNWVRAITTDKSGMLWIAADDGGLLYFDGAVMRYVVDVFDGEYVTAVAVDKNGELWVGTEGAGAVRYFPPKK